MNLNQLLFVIVFQCIMENVLRTLNRCDERLDFMMRDEYVVYVTRDYNGH